MKIRIEEIHSKNMFPGLIIGKPKDGHYEKSLKEMEDILGKDIPIHKSVSLITTGLKIKWL